MAGVCGWTAAAGLFMDFSECPCVLVCVDVEGEVCVGVDACVVSSVVRAAEFSQVNRQGIHVEFTP